MEFKTAPGRKVTQRRIGLFNLRYFKGKSHVVHVLVANSRVRIRAFVRDGKNPVSGPVQRQRRLAVRTRNNAVSFLRQSVKLVPFAPGK